MKIYIEGIGLCGPGLDGWAASRPILMGLQSYVPAPIAPPPCTLLPANERRRTVKAVKIALAVAAEAFDQADRKAEETATAFASSGGDGETIHAILDVLASTECNVSPTRFHNSVHNAPSGYWGIATQSREPSTSICCSDASFAAGLLETASQASVDKKAVALVAYELPYPEPLHSFRPIHDSFGVAFIVTPVETPRSLAVLDVQLTREGGGATPMADPVLEILRAGNPAARSLPILAALAGDTAQTITLDYVAGNRMHVSVAQLSAIAVSGRAA